MIFRGEIINPSLNIDCCHIKKLILKISKKPFKEVDYGISKEKYKRKIYKCLKCNHHFAHHKRHLIADLYKNQYFLSTYKNYDTLKLQVEKILNLPKSKSDNKNRVLRIKNFLKRKKIKKINLLDVGSGTGVFPISIAGKNIKVYSNEINNVQSKFIQKFSNNKITVFNSSFLSKNFKSKKKYDFITFNKVLEHIEYPSKFLKKTYKILNNSGYIYIEVPDIISKRKTSQYLWEEFGLGHLHIFSKKSLKLFVESLNYKIEELKSLVEPSGKHTIYCILSKNVV